MPALGVIKSPTGLIIKWTGIIADIPNGWLLCDGTNGTPDMRSRFSRQVPNATSDAGDTGGSDTHLLITSEMPSHSHAVVGDAHFHIWGSSGSNDGVDGNSSTVTSSSNNLGTIAIGDEGSDSPHENRPSYFQVAFIMKE